MRINLTKKDLVNILYMRVGFAKQIIENNQAILPEIKIKPYIQ